MTRIVRTHYRYKRPPRKRKAVALDVPAIVTIPDKKQSRVLSRIDTSDAAQADQQVSNRIDTSAAAPSANEDRKPAIVTIRKHKHAALAHLLDGLTAEESNRRADLADAMFQDMKRRIASREHEQ